MTIVEKVIEEHKTPWIKQWILHTVEIPENQAAIIAKDLSKSLDSQHNWYAGFKNDKIYFIIFRSKIFKINRINKEEYEEATQYGISLGIPDYQVDFSPHVKEVEKRLELIKIKKRKRGANLVISLSCRCFFVT